MSCFYTFETFLYMLCRNPFIQIWNTDGAKFKLKMNQKFPNVALIFFMTVVTFEILYFLWNTSFWDVVNIYWLHLHTQARDLLSFNFVLRLLFFIPNCFNKSNSFQSVFIGRYFYLNFLVTSVTCYHIDVTTCVEQNSSTVQQTSNLGGNSTRFELCRY